MRNLATGLALGFALGLVLSSVASGLDGGEVPTFGLILSAILLVGVTTEVLRVRRARPQNESISAEAAQNLRPGKSGHER